MIFVSAFRIVKFAFQDFWRNFWLSVVTITIIILALFSFTLLWGLNAVANAAVASVEKKINITLYFRPDVSDEKVLQVGKGITGWRGVEGVDFVSRNEALEQFQEKHANNPLILESLGELDANPLGSSLVIQAENLEGYRAILQRIDAERGLPEMLQQKDFQDYEKIITKLKNVRDRINEIGIAVSIIFAVIAVLVVFNTIRIGIYTRREEIAIMRLVGASNWFIRMPFIVGGILYAVFAAGIFWLFFFAVLQSIRPYTDVLFSDLGFDVMTYFQTHVWQLLAWQLAGMVFLNLLSISVALGRYLQV